MKRSRSRSSSISTSIESNLKKQKSQKHHKRAKISSSEEAPKSKRHDRATKHKQRKSSETAIAGPSEDAGIKRKKKKKHKKKKKEKKSDVKAKTPTPEECLNVPVELMDKSKAYAPMTKQEWDKQQSVVRKVYDETTGHHRLIKGDGEVIEEIVSKDRHMAINEQATRGDGIYFQTQLSQNK